MFALEKINNRVTIRLGYEIAIDFKIVRTIDSGVVKDVVSLYVILPNAKNCGERPVTKTSVKVPTVILVCGFLYERQDVVIVVLMLLAPGCHSCLALK